jgi:hypothetical protein
VLTSSWIKKDELQIVFDTLAKQRCFNASQKKLWNSHVNALISEYMYFVECVSSKDDKTSDSIYEELWSFWYCWMKARSLGVSLYIHKL